MDPASFVASVVTLIGVVTKTINYLNDIKNASTERKALSREAAGLLPILTSLKSEVEDHESFDSCSEGIRTLATEHGPLNLLQEALSQLATVLKPEKGRMKNLAGTLIWPLDKKLCEEILKKIERGALMINLALQSDIHKSVRVIGAHTASIQEHVSDLHVRGNTRERNDILLWFSPLNFSQVQQSIFGRRTNHTGEWLIDAPDFRNWIAGSEPTLCCSGIREYACPTPILLSLTIVAGAGKSVLASVIVDYLRNAFKASYSYSVAAAYCNFKERVSQSPENLLAGLCVQLIDEFKPLPETLVQLHGRHASKRTSLSLNDVLDVFKEVLKHFETTYLIVDALDECSWETRDILLRELKSLQPIIRLLVMTRPNIDQFAENATIEIRASHSDLDKYIQSRIASQPKLSSLLQGRTKLLEDIRSKVIDKASGM
ncbi:MAG: hypothetical protein Q9207_008114 [Kuettlingeria erythrocarpa]